jgi:phage shock protein E
MRKKNVARIISSLICFIACSLPLIGQEKTISSEDLRRELVSDNPPLLLDVRNPEEFAPEHLPFAVNFPLDKIDAPSAAIKISNLNTPIVVYCKSGKRSAKAVALLRLLGYSHVSDFGGIGNWEYGTVGEMDHEEN